MMDLGTRRPQVLKDLRLFGLAEKEAVTLSDVQRGLAMSKPLIGRTKSLGVGRHLDYVRPGTSRCVIKSRDRPWFRHGRHVSGQPTPHEPGLLVLYTTSQGIMDGTASNVRRAKRLHC